MNNKKKIRENFRNEVFERDNHKCRMCGVENVKLDAHHITDRNEIPNGGYVKENGISLCENCHIKAEIWNSSGNEKWVGGFHPYDLYDKIKSSKREAFEKAEKL